MLRLAYIAYRVSLKTVLWETSWHILYNSDKYKIKVERSELARWAWKPSFCVDSGVQPQLLLLHNKSTRIHANLQHNTAGHDRAFSESESIASTNGKYLAADAMAKKTIVSRDNIDA